MQPIYGVYVSALGPAGSLGLPTTQEIRTLQWRPPADLRRRRHTIYAGWQRPGDPAARIQRALSGVPLGSTLSLNLGQSVTLTATPRVLPAMPLTDRPVSWSTTNSRVVTITAGKNGTAVAKAVGGGAASLTAASEGKTSQKVNVIVISPCCQVGDGAPPLVQQSFKDALTRNKITVQPPIPSPAARVGSGYMQMVQSADAGAATYLVAQSDKVGSAFVVGRSRAGGLAVAGRRRRPAGLSGDATSVREARSALRTARLWPGIPCAWSAAASSLSGGCSGYETGAAGAPASDAAAFSTFGANSGMRAGLRRRRHL